MLSALAPAALPVVALGCSIYAIWSLWQGWKEGRSPSRDGRKPVEHPVAVAVQAGLSIVFSIALLVAGSLILARTLPESPFADWIKEVTIRNDSTLNHVTDLPGAFEVAGTGSDRTVLGVSLVGLPADDLDLAHMAAQFPDLEWLHLQGTRVTDSGLANLARLPNLRMLVLSRTAVGDRGLANLAGLQHLEELNLGETGISDAGLRQLEGLTTLRKLDLSNTSVTGRAVRRLRQQLPECKIHFRKRTIVNSSVPVACNTRSNAQVLHGN